MRLVWKTAFLLLLFITISPLFAQPLKEPQTNPTSEDSPPTEELPANDKLFFFEELFLFETFFLDALMGEETPSDKEAFLDEKTPPNEEFLLVEAASLAEAPPLNEETLLAEETSPNEAAILNDESSLSEEIPPDEETLLAEEDYIDDDALFFEALPLIVEAPTFEIRSLETIFPNLSQREKATAMSEEGLRYSFVKNESPTIIPNADLGIDLYSSVVKKNPSHIIEALVVVPYGKKELDLLDVYNAVGRIERIKDQTASLRGAEIHVFTESTRIQSARNRKDIPDPSPAVTLPFSETMYLRLKEMNLGNLFLRGDLSLSMYGITYSMTNFTDVRYFLIPIMKAERFITIIYLEPVKEGILMYSMVGFYLPGFIADRISLTPNITRRIRIFVKWITEGLRKQEDSAK